MTLPAPTKLTPTVRYIGAATRQYVWVPTIANKNAPTSAEITAGTDLSAEIPSDGVSGFTTTSDEVEVGDFGSRFASKIPGMINADSSSIALYADKLSQDARTLLTRGTDGFICVFPEGIVATAKMSVFPVRISSSSVESGGAADAGRLMVQFTITSEPAENIAIPTA